VRLLVKKEIYAICHIHIFPLLFLILLQNVYPKNKPTNQWAVAG
jgi:hypothetical protein